MMSLLGWYDTRLTSPNPQSGSFKYSRLQTFLYLILNYVSTRTFDIPGRGRAGPAAFDLNNIQQRAYKTIRMNPPRCETVAACFSLLRLSFETELGPTETTPIPLKNTQRRRPHRRGGGDCCLFHNVNVQEKRSTYTKVRTQI
jgi:hypothetical protein